MKVSDIVRIEASPEIVWAVTQDIERWPDWTPTVHAVRREDTGPFGAGSTAVLKQPGLPPSTWTVTEFVYGERFIWESRIRGINMAAAHELAKSGSGTQNTLTVEVKGLSAYLLWPLIRNLLAGAIRKENTGLKRICEEIAAKKGD